jgi:hypothetical protein
MFTRSNVLAAENMACLDLPWRAYSFDPPRSLLLESMPIAIQIFATVQINEDGGKSIAFNMESGAEPKTGRHT